MNMDLAAFLCVILLVFAAGLLVGAIIGVHIGLEKVNQSKEQP